MVRYILSFTRRYPPSLVATALIATISSILPASATPMLAQYKDQAPPVVDREREAILSCLEWDEQLDTREAMFDFDCAYRMLSEPGSDAALACERTGLRLDEETDIFNENCGQYFPR